MKEDDNVGSSIEGTKKTSVCVNPHQLGLTPPPYNNKQDYNGGTQDKTIDYNKNVEDYEYIDNPSIKNDKINSQSHENIRNRLLLKRFSG